jgi:protein NRD1
LTEADLKWVVTAEYGGTGGRELEAGMILEEPDIEIGAGVSSKAISQKIHLRGNTGGGGRGRNRGKGRGEREERWNKQEDEFSSGAAGSGVGGFPGFPMMPGQQGMFPPGQFPPGQFPGMMMPPEMMAFFQQQFGGGQGHQGSGQEGGFGEQQGDGQ